MDVDFIGGAGPLTKKEEKATSEFIKVSEAPSSKAKDYLKRMRRNAVTAPSLNEITKIIKEVRAERYGKK